MRLRMRRFLQFLSEGYFVLCHFLPFENLKFTWRALAWEYVQMAEK